MRSIEGRGVGLCGAGGHRLVVLDDTEITSGMNLNAKKKKKYFDYDFIWYKLLKRVIEIKCHINTHICLHKLFQHVIG